MIGHPCFLAPYAATVNLDGQPARSVSAYFEKGFWRSSNPNGIRARGGNYHRTIAPYLNALIRAGFRLDEINEPTASPLLAAEQPIYATVPIVFGLRAIVEERSTAGKRSSPAQADRESYYGRLSAAPRS